MFLFLQEKKYSIRIIFIWNIHKPHSPSRHAPRYPWISSTKYNLPCSERQLPGKCFLPFLYRVPIERVGFPGQDCESRDLLKEAYMVEGRQKTEGIDSS